MKLTKHRIKNIILTFTSPELYRFLFSYKKKINFFDRLSMFIKFLNISFAMECSHFDYEILKIVNYIFILPEKISGDIAEAGAFKGGSTAKLSLVAKALGKKLFVFDSFAGIPENNEYHSYLNSDKIGIFAKGEYKGGLTEVKKNIQRYGSIESCEFIKGDFRKTLPEFKGKLCAIFSDVDLAFSTKAVLKYLYPQLSLGGLYATHDGHLQIVVDVYKDKDFWKKESKQKKPYIKNLGKTKLITFFKS